MNQVTLRAAKRDGKGTRPARRLRREGRIPAIVYGHGMEALAVTVGSRDLFAVLHSEGGLNALIDLDVEGGKNVLTVAREIQRHPVRGEITHLDFIQVSLDEEISADVSVDYAGIPAGVSEDGGVVETIEATVTITALPTAIPSSIEVDISHMEIGDTLRLSDLPAIEGVTYTADPERPLLTVLVPRVEEEPEPAEGEELEGEPGAELEAGDEAEPADEESEAD
jgi:large subunit ribosomal protein L25